MNLEKKVFFLTVIPSPYRVDFFNELSKHCDLFVVYYEKEVDNLGWEKTKQTHNYKFITLFKKNKLSGIINLIKLLYLERKNIFIIGGYSLIPEIIAILFFKIIRVKFIISTDGGFIKKSFIKKFFKIFLIKSASYWLSSGVNSTKTLEYYGAKKNNIFEYPFTSIFKKEILSHVPNNYEKSILKKDLGLNPKTSYIIYVGRLIYMKGLDVLINAYSKLKLENIELLIIGDGEMLDELKTLSINNNIDSKITFLGKKNKQDVLKYLKLSDVFILPSKADVWGLVINEAIANGLVIISTTEVGGSYSLIKEGLNGYIINCGSEIELLNSIKKVYNDNLLKQQKISLNIAQEYTIENMVESHLRLISVLNNN